MNNVIRFVAHDVALDPTVGFIGFADKETVRYFWMQPGEMTTAKNEIWLERDDQAWGGYGEKWNVILTRNRFTVITGELPSMACDAIEINYTVDDATYAQLKGMLQKVMVDCPSDLDVRY
jgi:hypothetical protein